MNFVPEKKSKIPLYRQLGNFLINQIIESPGQGEWLLLPEREMSCAYGVSRSTIRQALQYAESRGFITRKPGSGTIVAERDAPTSLMQMYSFTKEMQRAGKVPSSKLIRFEVTDKYSKAVQEGLQLKDGDMVYSFQRVRYADAEVKMLENTYLPCSLLPGFDGDLLKTRSLYEILHTQYHISMDKASQEFEVASASRAEADLLQIECDEAVMLSIRIAYDGTQPVEYSHCIIPRGGMRYRVELKV